MKNKKTKQIHKKNEKISPEHTIRFLEDFRQLIAGHDSATQLISMRVPKNVLDLFKLKAKQNNLKYQSQIVALMRLWIKA